ncbi:MAG TPA: right-handed parallel beta-helix repeat-containing protein, partial [Tepidisphaeraceae bacterium]|nr:right-handed parallel beta-helix repeat-containing protein [Tepidisphaeraceae bacterium]
DTNDGSADHPLRTINAAAQLAEPGDTVTVGPGIYYEWVSPARGGSANAPIVYRSMPNHAAIVRGTDVLDTKWQAVSDAPGVFSAPLPQKEFTFGNVFVRPPKPAKKEPEWLQKCNALVFLNDHRLNQVVTHQELADTPGSWLSSDDGTQLFVHLKDNAAPTPGSIEITTRDRIFAPHRRGLGYIHVEGFIFERCASRPSWPQLGALSCRSGKFWVIRNNIVRDTTGKGIDCGSETWNPALLGYTEPRDKHLIIAGGNLVEDNLIMDNDECGICAWNTYSVRIIGNVVRNNCARGAEKPRNFLADAEAAGIKVHAFRDGVIEGNLVEGNSSFGIWLDNGWENARVTRNVCIGNRGAGIFVELGFGPCLVDHNLSANNIPLWLPYLGDGMYTHDASNITIVHNIFLDNARDGLRELVVTERSYANRRLCEASNEHISGNLFYGNHEGAICLPLDSPRSRYNHSDYNAFEPNPNFVINDCERRIPIEEIHQFCREALKAARVPEAKWPDLSDPKKLPTLSLPVWRLVMQMDQNSTVLPSKIQMQVNQSKNLQLLIDLPTANSIPVVPAEPGDDFDLLGQPIKPGDARAGAIQGLSAETRTISLWPLPATAQPQAK